MCTYARASKFYLRTNPIVAAGFSPKPAFTIYAGVGPGGAILSPSASNVDAGPAEEELAVTGAALLGLRFTGAAFPIVLEARADAVSDRGASAMLTFSLLIAD